jgi:hypothetical protein
MRFLLHLAMFVQCVGFDESGNILTTQILLSTCSCISLIDIREGHMKVKYADVLLF